MSIIVLLFALPLFLSWFRVFPSSFFIHNFCCFFFLKISLLYTTTTYFFQCLWFFLLRIARRFRFFRHKNTSFNVTMPLQFGCEQDKRTENRFKVNHVSVSNVVLVFFAYRTWNGRKKVGPFLWIVSIFSFSICYCSASCLFCAEDFVELWMRIKCFTFIILALSRWNALLVLHIRVCVCVCLDDGCYLTER